MRLLFPLATAVGALISSLGAAPAATGRQSNWAPAQECPEASLHFTGRPGTWRQDRVKPKKLAELPPAETFAAVYRRDERGCIVRVRYPGVRR